MKKMKKVVDKLIKHSFSFEDFFKESLKSHITNLNGEWFLKEFPLAKCTLLNNDFDNDFSLDNHLYTFSVQFVNFPRIIEITVLLSKDRSNFLIPNIIFHNEISRKRDKNYVNNQSFINSKTKNDSFFLSGKSQEIIYNPGELFGKNNVYCHYTLDCTIYSDGFDHTIHQIDMYEHKEEGWKFFKTIKGTYTIPQQTTSFKSLLGRGHFYSLIKEEKNGFFWEFFPKHAGNTINISFKNLGIDEKNVADRFGGDIVGKVRNLSAKNQFLLFFLHNGEKRLNPWVCCKNTSILYFYIPSLNIAYKVSDLMKSFGLEDIEDIKTIDWFLGFKFEIVFQDKLLIKSEKEIKLFNKHLKLISDDSVFLSNINFMLIQPNSPFGMIEDEKSGEQDSSAFSIGTLIAIDKDGNIKKITPEGRKSVINVVLPSTNFWMLSKHHTFLNNQKNFSGLGYFAIVNFSQIGEKRDYWLTLYDYQGTLIDEIKVPQAMVYPLIRGVFDLGLENNFDDLKFNSLMNGELGDSVFYLLPEYKLFNIGKPDYSSKKIDKLNGKIYVLLFNKKTKKFSLSHFQLDCREEGFSKARIALSNSKIIRTNHQLFFYIYGYSEKKKSFILKSYIIDENGSILQHDIDFPTCGLYDINNSIRTNIKLSNIPLYGYHRFQEFPSKNNKNGEEMFSLLHYHSGKHKNIVQKFIASNDFNNILQTSSDTFLQFENSDIINVIRYINKGKPSKEDFKRHRFLESYSSIPENTLNKAILLYEGKIVPQVLSSYQHGLSWSSRKNYMFDIKNERSMYFLLGLRQEDKKREKLLCNKNSKVLIF